MAYTPHRGRPQHVTIEAIVNGQSVVNTFWLRHSQGAGPGDGNSAALLSSFIAAYRLVMGEMYNVYNVSTYWIREVSDAILDPVPPPPHWSSVLNPLGVDFALGVPGTDRGLLGVAGLEMLPCHEALRARKRPETPRIGYYRASYNRFAPFSEADIGTTWESFNAATIVRMQSVFTAFNATTFDDGGTPPFGWLHGIFSPTLYGRVIKPAGGPIYSAITRVMTYTAIPWIGTQVTRRFKPSGLKSGA